MAFNSLSAKPSASARRQLTWGSIPLLVLGLLACQGGTQPTTSQPEQTATTAATAATAAAPSGEPAGSAPAAGAFTLLIDGQPKPLESLELVKTGEQGFQVKMRGEELDFTVISTAKSPLAVGGLPLTNTADSSCKANGQLPPPFNKESMPGYEYFASFMGSKTPPGATTDVFDWGTGPQPLRGEPVGQVQITRLADGTADGSFTSAVYTCTAIKPIKSNGQSQTLHLFKSHQLQCSFKALPYTDPVADQQRAKAKLK